MKLKLLILLLFTNSILISQIQIIPLENKLNYLYNNDVTNYYFKDVNNELEKFTGKWKFVNDSIIVELEILKIEKKYTGGYYYEDDLQIIIRKKTFNPIQINSNKEVFSHIIIGGYFENQNKINRFNLFFTEAIDKERPMLCGHFSIVNLDFEINSKILIWNINLKELYFIKSTKLFPNRMIFEKEN
ncbi:DUF6705 family protein [Flavobacterium sp.]|uniref:DUF6705 family protein n=1 Tax=Flavobacterium sp. TaxID=239 RepID=UPI00375364E7